MVTKHERFNLLDLNTDNADNFVLGINRWRKLELNNGHSSLAAR